jgi:CheY-like chemotaxis protein
MKMKPKQILIVDDDYAVRATIELSLQVTTNWVIWTANSGQEGLSMAKTKQPDLILLDMMMSALNGIEVLHQLRTTTATQEIPVIFLTATALTKEHEELKNLNIQGVISKPFDALGLGEQICSLLDWQNY